MRPARTVSQAVERASLALARLPPPRPPPMRRRRGHPKPGRRLSQRRTPLNRSHQRSPTSRSQLRVTVHIPSEPPRPSSWQTQPTGRLGWNLSRSQRPWAGHLGAAPDAVDQALQCWLEPGAPTIDRHALAALGIDLDTVRHQLEQTFGPGALERTQAGCLGICPHAKMALAFAVDHADGQPVGDDHLLLGMLNVPGCVAARVLAQLGVTPETVESPVRTIGDD